MIHFAWNSALAPLQEAAQSAAGRDATFWFPEQASEIAQSLDSIFYFILWVSIVSFVVVVGAAAMFVLRYRAREGHREEHTSTHDTRLELTWTIIPTIIVAVMFYMGAKGFFDLKQPPANAYEVQVVGFRWAWEFVYPNGVRTNELHVPIDEPVRLVMTSSDVLHSLFIPAFRVKMDVVPGRFTSLWFKPVRTGVFHLFCTEYCGTQHAGMITRVVVHEREDFEQWLADEANFMDRVSPLEAGEILYQRNCIQCHTLTTESKIGPGFKHLVFGETRPMADGSQVVVDEDYIRESILLPNARITAGYEGVVMTSFQGRLGDREIAALITFIKSLNE